MTKLPFWHKPWMDEATVEAWRQYYTDPHYGISKPGVCDLCGNRPPSHCKDHKWYTDGCEPCKKLLLAGMEENKT